MAFAPLLTISTFLNLALTTPFCWGAQEPRAPEKSVPLEDSAQVALEPDFSFAFCNDGSLLAAGGDAIRVWDTNRGALKMTVNIRMFFLAFSPDGMLLAGAGSHPNDFAAIWNLGDAQQQIAYGGISAGNLIRRFNQTNKTRINLSAALSPDTKLLAVGNGDDTITLWELTSGKELTVHQEDSYGAAIGFSQDSRYLASGGRDGTIRIWEVASRSEKYCLKGFPNRVAKVAFGDHDRLIVATAIESEKTGGKATVFVSRFPDGKALARLPDCYHPVLSADGRFLATLGAKGKTVSIQDLRKQSRVFEYAAKDKNRFRAIAFTPNNKLICLQSDSKQFTLLNLHTGIAEK